MTNQTTAYAEIVKYEKQADGTLVVYGKATDDTLDSDQQICDPTWLDNAMPAWFKYGNVREQHSSVAAGVATEYERKEDGHYISVHVIDTNSIKKVEAKVLKGFSIGIRQPRVVKDNKAAGGRIVDGEIVEISLVDRPANPACMLTVAKTINSELVQVEELVEKYNENHGDDGRFESGGGSDDPPTSGLGANGADPDEAHEQITDLESGIEDAQDTLQQDAEGDNTDDITGHLNDALYELNAAKNADDMSDIQDHLDNASSSLQSAAEIANSNEYGRVGDLLETLARGADSTNDYITYGEEKSAKAKSLIAKSKKYANADTLKFDQAAFDTARQALATLIQVEAGELADGEDEIHSLSCLLAAVHALFEWHEGEAMAGETMPTPETEEVIEMSNEPAEVKADETDDKMCDKCGKAATECECEAEKSDTAHKCLECGCHQPANNHGRDDVTTAEIISSDKSEQIDDTSATIEDVEQTNLSDEVQEVVTTEADADERIKALEAELAQVKALATPSGPKRFGVVEKSVDSSAAQAAIFRAKAATTLDKDLRAGYIALAREIEQSNS